MASIRVYVLYKNLVKNAIGIMALMCSDTCTDYFSTVALLTLQIMPSVVLGSCKTCEWLWFTMYALLVYILKDPVYLCAYMFFVMLGI